MSYWVKPTNKNEKENKMLGGILAASGFALIYTAALVDKFVFASYSLASRPRKAVSLTVIIGICLMAIAVLLPVLNETQQ